MVKRLSLFLICLTIALFTGCADAGAKARLVARPLWAKGSPQSLSAIVDNSKEQIPGEFMVYKVIPYGFDKDAVVAIASYFEINGSVQDCGDFYLIESQTKRFVIDKYSGSYALVTELPFEEMKQPLDPNKPDSAYIALAQKVLNESGIKREGLSETPSVFDYKKLAYADPDTNRETEYTILKGVVYEHTGLNGIPMGGVVPGLTMTFNAKGALINLWNPRCHCEKFGTYPLFSKSTALEMLKRLDSRNALVEGIGLNDTFTVNSIKLVYYCDPQGFEQKFLVPFYRMEGTNNRGEPAVGYVRAVEEKYIFVQNPPGFEVYPPEPQRTEFPPGSPDKQTPKPPSDPDVEQDAAKEKS